MPLRARSSLFFAAALTASAIFAACGSDDSSQFGDGSDGGEGSDATFDGSQPFSDGGGFTNDGSTPSGPITITPADQVIDIPVGASIPTVTYQALQSGKSVGALWSIDRGEIGSIDLNTGVFKPSGTIGGKTNITATVGSVTVATSVTVNLHFAQNGGGADDDAGTVPGAGGFGGVGGYGVGGPVANPAVFPGTPTADANLKVLYPYDGTVWPRGILPPLFQWTADKTWDGLYIHLKETSYEWSGTFSKPGLAPSFIDHPIPVDVWRQLAQSNAGEDVTVTIELTAGGTVYGPVTQTWKIASAPLKGTVYYQSYGTLLATNFDGALPAPGHRFGAATLGIHPGDTAPSLVAGKSTTDNSGCRVCHSVSADGSQLVTKWSDDTTTSTYDLHGTPGSNETKVPTTLSWPAVAPNGAFVFTDSSGTIGSNNTASALRWIPSGDAVTSTALPSGLRAAFPSFSPDSKHVAFTWYGGTVGSGTGDTNTLAMMDFAGPTGFEDAGGSATFSNFQVLFNPTAPDAGAPGGVRAMFPSFLPTNDAVVFQNELTQGRQYGETRATCDNYSATCGQTGATGELWWLDLKTKTPHRLDKLNGIGYLPDGGSHTGAADQKLNYEPTVNPVPSGGYAWVVFTSRRLYGNVATRPGYESDPRYADLTTSPTPKKLWVAAIDLNAPAGTDPSHPAFYLPAQELFAGNARGYWVVDPCQSDGSSCETGDECCGGYCRPGGDAGGLICTNVKPTCAQEFEKCTTAADCCDKANGVACIDGRCGKSAPR
ncbi:MAG TPA: hypothetical protein VF407_12375 [Polyangiaceae bacterium]